MSIASVTPNNSVNSKWPVVELGEIADFINGDRGKNYPSKSSFVSDGIPFINAGHLQRERIDFSEMNFITEDSYKALGSGKVQKNDILYCLRGSLGKTGIVNFNHRAAIASSLVIIRCHDNCGVDYLHHFLTGPSGQAEISRFNNGSSQPNLSASSVKKFKIPLPPLSEQKRIADILDKADAIRRKRQEAKAKYESCIPSLFSEMFGFVVTNNKEWPVVPFGNVCESRLGKMLDGKQQTGQHLKPYLRNTNVQWNHFDLSEVYEMDFNQKDQKEFRLKNGDLLVCEGGEVGRAAIWRDNLTECYFQKALHRVRPKPNLAVPEYLLHYMRQMGLYGGFRFLTSQATIAHLTGVKLKQLPLPLPPLDLQQQFACCIKEFEQGVSLQEKAEKESESFFNSLVQQAFKGEL